MQLEEYQQYVAEGASPFYSDLGFALLALVGEVGEVCDAVKKDIIYPEREQNADKIKDELGDVLWQWMAAVNAARLNVNDVLEYNVKKLNARQGGATLQRDGGKR